MALTDAREGIRPVDQVADSPAAELDFDQIYRDHAPFLWRTIRRLGVDARDVEDVCHEILMVAFRKRATYEPRAAVRTWLFAIAQRCVAAYRRHRSRRELPELAATEPTTALNPEVGAIARARLDRLLNQLDDRKREVFVLFELEALPMAEIAELVGCPLQTAYARLHAAREIVRKVNRRDALERTPDGR